MDILSHLYLMSLGWTFCCGFALTGCYSTTPKEKYDLTLAYKTEGKLTVSECSRKCQLSGRAYSGLVGGASCYCGDEFGHTPPMTDCNCTCSDQMSCGGVTSYNSYYVIDESVKEWKYKYFPDLKNFYDSRRKCISLGGDLVGRQVKGQGSQVSESVKNSSSTVTQIWLGLRMRDLEYEWVDEKDPNQGDTYAKEKYQFQNQWQPSDPQLKCVAYGVDNHLFASRNCSDVLSFVCYLPPLILDDDLSTSDTVFEPDNSAELEESSRSIALLVVLPLFLICYGGACILYCVHQIVKHCCWRNYKHYSRPPSRPSSSKKSSVHPEPIMTDQKLVPSLVPYPEKTPYAADPSDEKKAKLLENASKEARERREKEASRIFSGQRKTDPLTPVDSERSSGKSTSNLMTPPSKDQDVGPQAGDPAQSGMAGKSINEILRIKMAQQANKKRTKKILAA